jgi:predicted TIM-barrel fold metal-dependent hydrolase
MEHATTDVDLNTIDIRGLFRDHVFGCFIDDAHGIASIDEIGEDNIMCETDYPHSDSTWPNCISVVKKQIGHLPPAVQYKILRGNAEKLYRFSPAEAPVLADA